MFNKKQVNAIIRVLKNKSLDGRPALQQVFEQGGYLWATNSYIALELGEVKDEFKGKCITLQTLVGWSGTHKANDTTTLVELAEDNQFPEPDMVSLLHQDYVKATEFCFNINLLKAATDFLGVNLFTVKMGSKNKKCYLVQPLEKLHVANRAMGTKAYVMGLSD